MTHEGPEGLSHLIVRDFSDQPLKLFRGNCSEGQGGTWNRGVKEWKCNWAWAHVQMFLISPWATLNCWNPSNWADDSRGLFSKSSSLFYDDIIIPVTKISELTKPKRYTATSSGTHTHTHTHTHHDTTLIPNTASPLQKVCHSCE